MMNTRLDSSSDDNSPPPKKRQLLSKASQDHANQPPSSKHERITLPIEPSSNQHKTISIAVPGSIIDNCQSLELKTYVAGQIGRAAAIYKIDEIIVYNESPTPMNPDPLRDPNVFLAKILLYQECPQYLRKHLFPIHKSLQYAGLLNPLDTPHHVRIDDHAKFREGVVLAKRPLPHQRPGSLVHCGLRQNVYVPALSLKPGIRVTVQILDNGVGKVVNRSVPRISNGIYSGYTVRLAEGISQVFEGSSSLYDLKIGTSERGRSVTHAFEGSGAHVRDYNRALIVFGGLKGIEGAIDADEQSKVDAQDAHVLFDYWINTCHDQGCRTIRTEEAVLASLATLTPHLYDNDLFG